MNETEWRQHAKAHKIPVFGCGPCIELVKGWRCVCLELVPSWAEKCYACGSDIKETRKKCHLCKCPRRKHEDMEGKCPCGCQNFRGAEE